MGDIGELAWKLCQQAGCGLSKRQLVLCVALVQEGISPEAIVHILKELPAALARRRLLLT